MDQHSGNVESSDTESLPYSMSDSDSGSLVESIGSFDIESRETAPKPGASFRRPRKDKQSGTQFLQFSKEMRDVPVSAAWQYIRNHRNMANIARGVIGYFDYLEGDGATGSVFIAKYTPKYTLDERYVIHKVEVRDDNSQMYAVRCVGGRYQKRYHLYFTFIKVVPHEVLGDSSSTIIWRLQYELRDPSFLAPQETKIAYLTALETIRDQHFSMNRVQRPLISHAMSATMTKRLKVLRCRQARQQRIASDQQTPGDPSEQRSVQLVEIDGIGDDQDGQKKQMSRGKMGVQLVEKDQGDIDREEAKNQRPRRKATSQLEGKDKGDIGRDEATNQRPRRKATVQLVGKDEGDIDRDEATNQRPRRKASVQLLVKNEDGTGGDSFKRQRRSKSDIQQIPERRKRGSTSRNS